VCERLIGLRVPLVVGILSARFLIDSLTEYPIAMEVSWLHVSYITPVSITTVVAPGVTWIIARGCGG
jgi:uncharacterized membrane protein